MKQYVLFTIGKEQYAINIMNVLEIIRIPSITRVPNTSKNVEGVVNLRGNIISINNLHTLFGLERNEETHASRIIILNTDKKVRGIRVDSVDEVCTLDHADIEAIPNIFSTTQQSFIREIGKMGDKILGILGIDNLLEAIG